MCAECMLFEESRGFQDLRENGQMVVQGNNQKAREFGIQWYVRYIDFGLSLLTKNAELFWPIPKWLFAGRIKSQRVSYVTVKHCLDSQSQTTTTSLPRMMSRPVKNKRRFDVAS